MVLASIIPTLSPGLTSLVAEQPGQACALLVQRAVADEVVTEPQSGSLRLCHGAPKQVRGEIHGASTPWARTGARRAVGGSSIMNALPRHR